MANEITVRNGFTYRKGNVNYQRGDVTFKDDVSATYPAGPGVGAIIATTEGTDVNVDALIDPGWCRITNQENADGTDVVAGLYDPETDRFYPIWKIKPGHLHQGCLDEMFGWSEFPASVVGTGSGTATQRVRLRIRAKSHSCYVLVELFER